jgi:hypothetical protein
VEHYEWMNDQLRKEIEDLQRAYGFDEDEALAYWHLRHAGTLLLAMRRTSALERAEEVEESVRLARMIRGRAQIESNILQHLSALRRELARRSGVAQELPRRMGQCAQDRRRVRLASLDAYSGPRIFMHHHNM